MCAKEITIKRIRSGYSGMRYPSIIMYPPDAKAKKVNSEYWRKRVGEKYSYADVIRSLTRAEAAHIEKYGRSLLDPEPPVL